MNDKYDPTYTYSEETRLFTVPSGEQVEIDKHNFITTEVVLDVELMIFHNLSDFLTLLSLKATDSELLCDITYRPIRITPQECIVFEVSGDVSMVLEADKAMEW